MGPRLRGDDSGEGEAPSLPLTQCSRYASKTISRDRPCKTARRRRAVRAGQARPRGAAGGGEPPACVSASGEAANINRAPLFPRPQFPASGYSSCHTLNTHRMDSSERMLPGTISVTYEAMPESTHFGSWMTLPEGASPCGAYDVRTALDAQSGWFPALHLSDHGLRSRYREGLSWNAHEGGLTPFIRR